MFIGILLNDFSFEELLGEPENFQFYSILEFNAYGIGELRRATPTKSIPIDNKSS